MRRLAILPATTDGPLTARKLVRAEMADCSKEAVAAADLMISELVTNAVVHADTPIQIELEHEDNALRAVVTDGGSGFPSPGHPDQFDEHGRGLLLVRSLAEEWGIIERETGKSVWFTLSCR